MYFSFQLLYSSALIGSFLYFLFVVDVLILFLHSSPEFSKRFYDCWFELFIRLITYLHFIKVLFVGFYLVLSFGTGSSVFSFCLTFCVFFYELGKTASVLKVNSYVGLYLCTTCAQWFWWEGWSWSRCGSGPLPGYAGGHHLGVGAGARAWYGLAGILGWSLQAS